MPDGRNSAAPSAGGSRPRLGLRTLILLPSVLAALGVAVLLVLPARRPSDAAMREASADRAALDALASALAPLPAERRAAMVDEWSRGFPGRLALVGPGVPAPPGAGPSSPALPWRVPAGGLAAVHPDGAGWTSVSGVALPGGGRGAGLVAAFSRSGMPAGASGGRFAATFGLALVGLALLPALLLVRRVRGDLRRVEGSLAELAAAAESRETGADAAMPEQPAAASGTDDELGLAAWSAAALRTRLVDELRQFHRARARLARADQDKIDFLAVMSHELRTPLNTILGFSEVLLEDLEGPLTPGQREDLRIVRDSGDHLLGLVNDILDLSALHAGQLRAEFAEVDVVEVVRTVLDEAEGQIREKPVHLAMRLERERLVLRADGRLLRRALQNLVGNALKFTRQGEVRVDVRRDGTDVVLAVSDTGPGIAPEALAMIFEEYRQTGDARTKREGTGLGLAIVRRLAELHGGTVTAASTLGQGSTFTVRVPAAGPPAGGDGG